MKIPLLLLSLLLLSTCAFSQDSTLRKKYILKTIIEPTGRRQHPITTAFLADINDTAVLLMKTPMSFRQLQNANPIIMPYQQIRTITVYRKGSVGRAALVGTIAGAVIGGIIGGSFTTCSDCPHNYNYLGIIGGTMLGATGGCLVGVIVGNLTKTTFTIGGRKDKFQKMKVSVLERAYQ